MLSYAIKELNAYNTAKIHKNKLEKNQTVSLSWIRICFFNIRDRVCIAFGTVRLITYKIKGCKSLRHFNHLPISPPQCISTTSTPTNVTTFFMFFKMTDENIFDRF